MNTRSAGFATLILLCGSLVTASAQAQYKPMKLIGGGYKSKQVSADRWKVRGYSVDLIKDHSVHIALYRAAILTKRAGFTHFQIVDAYLEIPKGGYGSDQNAEFTVVGTKTPHIAIPCEATKEWIANCRLLNIDDVLSRSGAVLGRNPEIDLKSGT